MEWPPRAGPLVRLRIWSRRVAEDRRTRGAPQSIASILAEMTHTRRGWTWAGYDHLARASGYDRRTVIRAVGRLVTLGYLGQLEGGGRGRASCYWAAVGGEPVLLEARGIADRAARTRSGAVGTMRPLADAIRGITPPEPPERVTSTSPFSAAAPPERVTFNARKGDIHVPERVTPVSPPPIIATESCTGAVGAAGAADSRPPPETSITAGPASQGARSEAPERAAAAPERDRAEDPDEIRRRLGTERRRQLEALGVEVEVGSVIAPCRDADPDEDRPSAPAPADGADGDGRGAALATARRAAGMSQAELAEHLGVTRGWVGAAERGHRPVTDGVWSRAVALGLVAEGAA